MSISRSRIPGAGPAVQPVISVPVSALVVGPCPCMGGVLVFGGEGLAQKKGQIGDMMVAVKRWHKMVGTVGIKGRK